jgi:hypothetical protein
MLATRGSNAFSASSRERRYVFGMRDAVAILGWGSLVWCPGLLRITSRWRTDGPRLAIEFARISKDGRLTLVIYPGSPEQGTYWAVSGFGLDDSVENLRKREGTCSDRIHHLVRSNTPSPSMDVTVAASVQAWLQLHTEVIAAVWTGLPSNWPEKRGVPFTIDDAERYLVDDCGGDAAERAREYVCNAPPHIQTHVRERMRRRGWADNVLAPTLFEETSGES